MGRYPFDCPQVGADVSGHGYYGVTGAVAVVPGWQSGSSPVHGSALRFNPTNNVEEFLIAHRPALDLQGDMAVLAWIRPLGEHAIDGSVPGCTQGTICSKGGNYWFQISHANDAIEFQNEGSGAELAHIPVPGGIPTDGSWTHVAVVRSMRCNEPDTLWSIRAFVNGAFIGAAGLNISPTSNVAPVSVGNYCASGPDGCEFNGDIDDLMIFGGCLTDGDVRALYEQRATLPDSCPASDWPANIPVSNDSLCCFDVTIRDAMGSPVPGANVVVNFGPCPVVFCPQQAAGVTVNPAANTASVVTDFTGKAHFCICAAIVGPCTASLYSDGVLLAALPVTTCGSTCERSAMCDTCAGPISADSVRYGRWDRFDTTDGIEPATPAAPLTTYCTNSRPFDDVSCDKCFAHTLNFPVRPGCSVIGGTLRLSLRSCGNTLNNDAIHLMHHGFPVWSRRLAALAPGGHWNGTDSMTLVLDLCHLPTDSTDVSATYYLWDGSFDVYIQDDTAVDYMELGLCWCCYGEIHGRKFEDSNRNGVRDGGEPGLPGWSIDLTGPVATTTTTGTGGVYQFTGLPNGNYTVSEVNQPGWVNTGGASRAVTLAGGSMTGIDFANWQCRSDRPDTCAAPPRCTVTWYPFDEMGGVACYDLASAYTGTFVGSPTRVDAGKFGHAMHFPGGPNFVAASAASTSRLNFGTGSFTIDAWIRTSQPASGVRTLVDKRMPGPVGYSMYLYQGKLGIQVAAGAFPNFVNYSTGPALNDGNWHFVAATVCRPPTGARTVKLYTDGMLRGTFDADVPAGSVTNTGNLTIGQVELAIDGAYDNFVGDIDELELMNCCVDSSSLARVYTAGLAGKCREECYISYSTPWSNGNANTYLVICNNSATTQSYHWSLAPCTASGLSFSPNSGVVTLAPHGCQSILINGSYPAMSFGESFCFLSTVINDSTGHCLQCEGTISRPTWWYGSNCALAAVPLGVPQEFSLGVRNTDDATHVIQYRLADVSGDGDSANAVVSLNGLPPGVPVTGTLSIAARDSATIAFTAQMDDFQPFTIHEVVLSGDLDGNGLFESICGQPISNMAAADSTVGVQPAVVREFARITAGPNPFQRSTSVQFVLPAAGVVRVEVYDVLGRLVRTLQSGRLAAGAHHVEWDGRGASGSRPRGAVFFVRVQLDTKVLTTKVVQLR